MALCALERQIQVVCKSSWVAPQFLLPTLCRQKVMLLHLDLSIYKDNKTIVNAECWNFRSIVRVFVWHMARIILKAKFSAMPLQIEPVSDS